MLKGGDSRYIREKDKDYRYATDLLRLDKILKHMERW